MAGERELFVDSKNAHAVTFLFRLFEGAGKDECGFGEIGFPGDGLHLLRTESRGIGKHSQLISLQCVSSEYINGDKGQARHERLSLVRYLQWMLLTVLRSQRILIACRAECSSAVFSWI